MLKSHGTLTGLLNWSNWRSNINTAPENATTGVARTNDHDPRLRY
jgi:hypothetical protein